MSSLGSLGTKKPTIDLDFDYFGETIRVAPSASILIEMEFLRAAQGLDLDGVDFEKELTPESMAKVAKAATSGVDLAIGAVRKLIHTDDWDRFWNTAIANGQDLSDLLEVQSAITAAVAEVVAGFPTGLSPASSDGPVTTPPKSAADSPLPGGSAADKALATWRKRPDLQEFVVMNEEAGAVESFGGLTLADLCAVAYVLLVDELERHFHTRMLVTGMARAAGADKVTFPDWYTVRRDFDTQLAAEPEFVREDDDKSTLLLALGLR